MIYAQDKRQLTFCLGAGIDLDLERLAVGLAGRFQALASLLNATWLEKKPGKDFAGSGEQSVEGQGLQ